ncbi:hypothetical protein J7J74_00460 [bacterium]|nr:hypothetical protein [bacterium]
MRKFIKRLIILLFLGAVTPVFLVLAQPPSTSSLEVSYPTLVPGVAPPRSVQTYLPNYIRYLYTGAIALGGLIAFSSLLLGGGKYLTSAGNPAQMKDARDQILSAFLGLILILGSYLLVNLVNPEITELRLPSISPHKEGIIIYNVSCNDLRNAAIGVSDDMLGLPELLNLPDNIVWLNIKNTTNNITLPDDRREAFPVASFVTFHTSEELTIDFCSLNDFGDCHSTNEMNRSFGETECIDINELKSVSNPSLDVRSIKFKWYRPGVWLFAYGSTNPTDSSFPDPRKPNDNCGQDNCYIYTRSSIVSLPNGLFDNVHALALVNTPNEKFGAILHNIPGANPKEKGWAQIFLPDENNDITLYVFNNPRDASSLTVFRIEERGGGSHGVTICRDPRCEEREYEENGQREYRQPGIRITLGQAQDISSNICQHSDVTTFAFGKKTTQNDIHPTSLTCPQGIVYRYPQNNILRNVQGGWKDLRTYQNLNETIERRDPSGVSAVYIDDGSGFLVMLYDTSGASLQDIQNQLPDQVHWDVALLRYDIPDLSTIHMNERTTMVIIIRSKIMAQ